MWHISKEAKEQFVRCHLLPIHESDEDWELAREEAEEEGEDLTHQLKEELEEVKEELVKVLPSRFIPYLKNGTLNQPTLPKSIREDYLQWMREAEQEFEQKLDAAYEQTMQAVQHLSNEVQEVFSESLHDSTIQRIERTKNDLHLYINTDGGFSSKSMIHLTFKEVISEQSDVPIQTGQWIIYYEMKKTSDGFAFRVLFEVPDAEWTITMKRLEARYFYRPKAYVLLNDEEKLSETTLSDYIKQLNPDDSYWLITPHVICPVKVQSDQLYIENGEFEAGDHEFTVTIHNERYTYSLEEAHPADFIYTDVYENAYAHLEDPVSAEELETAALSDELELQVRAWNTMYANPHQYADIINRILAKIEITEENEMMLYVYVGHFQEAGVLNPANIEKFRAVMGE